MKYRNPKKENDLFSMIEHQQEVIRTAKGINKLNAMINWDLFRSDLESLLGYDVRDAKSQYYRYLGPILRELTARDTFLLTNENSTILLRFS